MFLRKDERIQLNSNQKFIIEYIEGEHGKGLVAYKSKLLKDYKENVGAASFSNHYRYLRTHGILEDNPMQKLPKDVNFKLRYGKEIKKGSIFLTTFYFENKEKIYYT